MYKGSSPATTFTVRKLGCFCTLLLICCLLSVWSHVTDLSRDV